MVRWTTLILFLAVLTVTTDSLRVFPESIRLFYRLYRAVARGGRILRDIAEGAGTVSEAIKSIDDLLDRSVDDPPVKEKLDASPSVDMSKGSKTTTSATQTGKSSAKKKESQKPPLDEKIVVTKHVSDDTIIRMKDGSNDSSKKKVPKDNILADAKVQTKIEQAAPSGKKKAPVESQDKATSDSVDEVVTPKEDLVVAIPDTEKESSETSPCQVSSPSSKDQSCLRPTTPKPSETDLPLPTSGALPTMTAEDPKLPSLSGCGALELHIKAPNLPVDKMTACCDAHDACYIAACKANKRVCDNMLGGCLFSICEDKAIKMAPGNLPNYCNAAAKLLYSGTMALSFHQYKEAQDQLKCRG